LSAIQVFVGSILDLAFVFHVGMACCFVIIGLALSACRITNSVSFNQFSYIRHIVQNNNYLGDKIPHRNTMSNITITHFNPPALVWLYHAAQSVIGYPDSLFWFLFAFRYLRLFVHIISYLFIYKPSPVPGLDFGSYARLDCTAIIPTVDPTNKDFLECLKSILVNAPKALILTTVGRRNARICQEILDSFERPYGTFTEMTVVRSDIPNKRRQLVVAIPTVTTKITLLVDDHVFWPCGAFLPTVLAPFEDMDVGCVGTRKVVRREYNGIFQNFLNFIGCTYLARHNFELTATNAIDGGVFVVSGRTSILRTEILQDPAFLKGFINEMFFFGKLGPLNADDDNFITRWLVSHGWKIKFQNTKNATIETTLGESPRLFSQIRRWTRTTWRSNSASLFTDGTVWSVQPWCVYAVYITSFVNFALFYDAALLSSLYATTSFGNNSTAVYTLCAWIFVSKMVKLIPHFLRHPFDILMIPAYILFAYAHSFIKLYALLTFWKITWGGRNLDALADDDDDGVPYIVQQADPKADWEAEEELFSNNSSNQGSVHSGNGFQFSDIGSKSSHTSSDNGSDCGFPPHGTVIGSGISTPWGRIRRNNPACQPANTNESIIGGQPALNRCHTHQRQLRSDLRNATRIASGLNAGSESNSTATSSSSSTQMSGRVSNDGWIRVVSDDESAMSWGNITLSKTISAHSSNNASNAGWKRVEFDDDSALGWGHDKSAPSWGSIASSHAISAHSSDNASNAGWTQVSSDFESGYSTESALSARAPFVLYNYDASPQGDYSANSSSRSSVSPYGSSVRGRRHSPAVPRYWTRGRDCGRAHEGGCRIDANGRCQIGRVHDVMWNGR
jgi:hypothetical protein